MNTTAFWELIDKTREASCGDQEQQRALLINTLAQLPEEEIFAWDDIFDDLMDQAYSAELWEVAYIVGCGCGDDGFTDFRAWLISQGRDMYEKVLADPECLADIIEVGKEDQAGASSLWYVVIGAYLLKTGKDIEDMPKRIKPNPELKGKHSASEDAILTRFPKATARFWKRCLDEAGLDEPMQ